MRNNQINIPRDIETHIAKRRMRNLAALVLIETVLVTILVLFGNDIFSGDYPGLSYFLFGTLMIAPIYWLRIPFWLFDKTWMGEIIQKSEDDYITTEDKTSYRSKLQVNKRQDLLIKLDSGKVIEYTVYDNKARHAFRRSVYNVGDCVVHVGGTGYLQVAAVGDDDTVICVVCGAESKADMTMCGVCGKTLKIN